MSVRSPLGAGSIAFMPMTPERRDGAPGSDALMARDPAARGGVAAPPDTGDGWRVAPAAYGGVSDRVIADMVAAISAEEYPNTHSVLLAKSGVLVVEEYFYGFDRDMLHDMRSASKSITSVLIGQSIARGHIAGAEAPALPLLKDYRAVGNWDPRKADITLRDLMTMSSGLDANDSSSTSAASENRYQSQTAVADWTKFALDAPLVSAPGEHLVYGSANPLILGSVLDNVVGERVEWFADTVLFAPLGIRRYRIFQDPTGVPYMGGGMYLRPRDMLKIGQMYLDEGRWRGRQLVPESWVEESLRSYGRLEPLDRNGNEYGYLWWHERYSVAGGIIRSSEARGNGGQYIFILPELDAVAVITSGNYRGGLEMTRQPQRLLQGFLLPALLQKTE